MESEGIATFADQLDVQAQVLVLRVVTDALFDKERHNQAELMMEGRVYLKTLVDSLTHKMDSSQKGSGLRGQNELGCERSASCS